MGCPFVARMVVVPSGPGYKHESLSVEVSTGPGHLGRHESIKRITVAEAAVTVIARAGP
jgi:hypothetical protein